MVGQERSCAGQVSAAAVRGGIGQSDWQANLRDGPQAANRIMAPIGNHSFRATGITTHLANCGALKQAQSMAAHESPRTTKLYDGIKERLTQDEIERIVI
jgi:integrase